MDYSSIFKNLPGTVLVLQSSRSFFSASSRSTSHYLFTILIALILIITVFFFSASGPASPAVISYTSLASRRLHSPSLSPSHPYTSCTVSAVPLPSPPPPPLTALPTHTLDILHNNDDDDDDPQQPTSCNVFDGSWIQDEGMEPLYRPGTCPFVDEAFNCFDNGRPDSDYLKFKWKPRACEIPRFDGLKMLDLLRGKQLVFVGDSLNRNMWESFVCAIWESLPNKTNVVQVSGSRQFRTQRFYSIKFQDFNCSIDFVKSPFLVQEWKFLDKTGIRRETLRLDVMESYHNEYMDADIVVFNTGHWWTHKKTYQGKYYFQEGAHVYSRLKVADAYKKALQTWAKWVDSTINTTRTTIFFRSYSSSHFKGGRWDSGGSCDGETKPITEEAHLAPHPWMARALESVLSKMKTPVQYLNITRMTDYRKDGHPSVYRQSASSGSHDHVLASQDCSHWCLPGVPDSWNQLLYAILIKSQKEISPV
ncbi:protein trichome birefringence-like 4 [Andrographis paniculata]|uniref:protein trichome birefringence-like 4 n=1 Tax=Andrographis paniculata TaxID=175694 RepID=UPI0021E7DF29|nr:protein trichome birefringence-like 4 [Andrographis paniculata]